MPRKLSTLAQKAFTNISTPLVMLNRAKNPIISGENWFRWRFKGFQNTKMVFSLFWPPPSMTASMRTFQAFATSPLPQKWQSYTTSDTKSAPISKTRIQKPENPWTHDAKPVVLCCLCQRRWLLGPVVPPPPPSTLRLFSSTTYITRKCEKPWNPKNRNANPQKPWN